ncbi:ferredoxin-type protein NapF [Kistimonas asteriae]|uniref:ferredoxin-type protein NapF n=1 Tax=Kistimonas asteriae TaxID=517724 RepID=UPI001BAB1305|nr:ferredoxin-type protein NapF [Kistimonas asteriae]
MSQEELASPARRAFFRRFALKEETIEIPESDSPRPPWARNNREFLALCDSCHMCIDACPERILRASDESHAALQGKPVLNIDYGYCTFCAECVSVCPTGALDSQKGYASLPLRPTLTTRCQAEMGMACNLCAEACSKDAITADGLSAPVIQTDSCNGCGACAFSCLSSTIKMTRISNT